MTIASTALFGIYTGLTTLLRPLVVQHLKHRVGNNKEDPVRFIEKMAVPSIIRPAGSPLVWIHAVSVGESISAIPLIHGLIDKHYTVLVTTSTTTSAKMLENRLPQGAIHQYAPLDCPKWIRTFLQYWHPTAVIFMESELWFNTLAQVKKQDIPLYLVNARLSKKSIKRWQKYTGVARPILQKFTKIYPQNTHTQSALQHILKSDTTPPIEYIGNLKYVASHTPVPNTDIQDMRAKIGSRPVWLIASSHPEDEQILHDALPKIYQHIPNILTILVPRHPHRLPDIQTTFKDYTQAVRSKGDIIATDTHIYIADTMGELGLFYTIAPICLVGGGFDGGYGGHNPLEPARYNTAILQGFNTSNFADVTTELTNGNAHIQITDARHLAQTVCHLLSDKTPVQHLVKNAKKIVNQQNTIVEKYINSMDI